VHLRLWRDQRAELPGHRLRPRGRWCFRLPRRRRRHHVQDIPDCCGLYPDRRGRHSAFIRGTIKESPFPQPFDAPLDYNEVYTLAAPFITGCPKDNPALPVKAFPMLAASSTDKEIKEGSTVTLATKGYKIEGKVYAAFIAVTGPTFVDAKEVDGGFEAVVPKGFAGQTYVVLTSCNTAATDDTIVAGPGLVEVTL
jgi:hypothetical protein